MQSYFVYKKTFKTFVPGWMKNKYKGYLIKMLCIIYASFIFRNFYFIFTLVRLEKYVRT